MVKETDKDTVVKKETKTEPRAERRRSNALDSPKDKLKVYNRDAAYHYRWVRNDEGRVQWFKERGYDVVTGSHAVGEKAVDSGTQLGTAVTKFGGGNVTLILMRIPREWFNEDQEAKEAEVAAVEATMKQPDSREGQYGSGLRLDRRK